MTVSSGVRLPPTPGGNPHSLTVGDPADNMMSMFDHWSAYFGYQPLNVFRAENWASLSNTISCFSTPDSFYARSHGIFHRGHPCNPFTLRDWRVQWYQIYDQNWNTIESDIRTIINDLCAGNPQTSDILRREVRSTVARAASHLNGQIAGAGNSLTALSQHITKIHNGVPYLLIFNLMMDLNTVLFANRFPFTQIWYSYYLFSFNMDNYEQLLENQVGKRQPADSILQKLTSPHGPFNNAICI
jgi:hypothetical protein